MTKKFLFLSAMVLMLTSCEGTLDDVFGEWSRPSGNTTPKSMLETPLTLEATSAGTIVVNKPQTGMQYSLNGGAKTTLTADPTNITVAAGDKLAFYGKGTTITAYCSNGSDNTNIKGSGTGFTFKVYGNIMSLVDEEGFATATTLSASWAFTGLFSDNVSLTDASGLQLPATTVTERCYARMFEGCKSLTTAPELPAETMENSCYYDMFNGCKALTTAPELPATTLASSCYHSMFNGCKALTTAPALPATTLAENCYTGMFSDCSNLTTAPELPATTLVRECYFAMFQLCSKLGSVTCKATSGFDTVSPLYQWLNDAGTADGCAKELHVVTGDSHDWQLTGGWSKVADVTP